MAEFTYTRNREAQQEAAEYAARFLTGISEETRAAVRSIIVRSIREGIAPLDAAKMIRSIIGLNAPQAQAAANYHAQLKLRGLSDDRVDHLLDRYVAGKLRERSAMIAQTELLGALNGGAVQSWLQAQKAGLLTAAARKKWITTPDELTCKICRPMHMQEQPLRKPFVLPTGKKIMFPPAHVRCRCTVGEPSLGKTKRGLLGLLDSLSPTLASGVPRLGNWDTFGAISAFDIVRGGKVVPVAFRMDEHNGAFEALTAGVAQLLKIGHLLPPTVYREVAKLGFGSLQQWIPETATYGDLFEAAKQGGLSSLVDISSHVGETFRDSVSILDYLTWHMDRHQGNLLVRAVPRADFPLLDYQSPDYAERAGRWLRSVLSSPLRMFAVDNADTFLEASTGSAGRYGAGAYGVDHALYDTWRRAGKTLRMSKSAADMWADRLASSREELLHVYNTFVPDDYSSWRNLKAEFPFFKRRLTRLIQVLQLNEFGKLFVEG